MTSEQLQFMHRNAGVRQTRQRFVPQVVPAQLDSSQDVSVGDALPRGMTCGFDVVRQEQQRFPL